MSPARLIIIFAQHGEIVPGDDLPIITGTAYVTGEATPPLDEMDPFRWGMRA